MLKIETFTTHYIAEEDRLAIDARISAKVTRRLWLTRRLLVKLLPPMQAQLEQTQANKSAPQPSSPATKATKSGNQSDSQSAQSQPPVTLNDSSRNVLITRANFQCSDAKFALTLSNSDESDSFQIFFTTQTLEQWFAIIDKQCALAQWSQKELFSEPASNTADIGNQVVH